ncbi:MAG: hypothetical protein NT105_20885 [Verrucomicrobia bacterium]|nr:hypothetical protein [Verrucomicrobiota bacterium]
MNKPLFCCLAGCAAMITLAGPPDAPFAPDEYTLLLAHFDKNTSADHSLGLSLADGGGTLIQQGRFGGGIVLGRRQTLTFSGKANFPGNEGTIEFWIQPQWNGDDGKVHSVFSAAAQDHNQISINKLATGRFGVGMFGTPRDSTNFVYRRADHDISTWKAGEWHHVAVCWSGGELALWLDDRKMASKTGALPPQKVPDAIRFQGDGCALDELCISRVVRYTDKSRAVGKPVAPRTRLGYDWKFNEPAGVYRCTPPDGVTVEAGVVVLPKNYLDDTDPQKLPPVREPRIALFASPGELEPATFLVIAAEPLEQVSVRVSDLKSKRGSLSSKQITVRRVVRAPMRKIYTAKATETDIINRFLPRWQALDIPAGELREAWLSLDLPADLPPGTYKGNVTIAHAAGQRIVPMQLEVLPITLIEHPRKALASYYTMDRRMSDRGRVLRELRDMRAHGICNLFSGLGIRYEKDGDKITTDFSEVREGLNLLRQGGFAGGTIVLETGFPTLARMLGHDDLGKGQSGESLDDDKVFQQVAKDAMQQFVKLQQQTPDFRLFMAHLDEVFGSRSLLDQYIRLSKVARQVPEAKLYITFHTMRENENAWRHELDPFVDLRCNHGYTFELWLARGHTMDEYDAELKAGGDEAWFYHNARGTYWTPEWSRIINGVYLWAGPFTAHCPWTYQAYFENPFDDTDGPATKGHDWGLSFPGINDPADLIPTRCYEAMREGGDDLRYIATLEKAIAGARPAKPKEAAAAQAVLDRWRNLIRKARPAAQKTSPAPASNVSKAVDADTGLIMGEGVIGTAAEAPLVNALATRFTGDQWQQMRHEIANWIIKLQ